MNKPDFQHLSDAFAGVIADKLLQRLGGVARPRSRPEQRLLRVHEVGLRLGRSKAAVYHMISHGVLPTVRIDRRVFVDSRDLDHFIDANRFSNN